MHPVPATAMPVTIAVVTGTITSAIQISDGGGARFTVKNSDGCFFIKVRDLGQVSVCQAMKAGDWVYIGEWYRLQFPFHRGHEFPHFRARAGRVYRVRGNLDAFPPRRLAVRADQDHRELGRPDDLIEDEIQRAVIDIAGGAGIEPGVKRHDAARVTAQAVHNALRTPQQDQNDGDGQRKQETLETTDTSVRE